MRPTIEWRGSHLEKGGGRESRPSRPLGQYWEEPRGSSPTLREEEEIIVYIISSPRKSNDEVYIRLEKDLTSLSERMKLKNVFPSFLSKIEKG